MLQLRLRMGQGPGMRSAHPRKSPPDWTWIRVAIALYAGGAALAVPEGMAAGEMAPPTRAAAARR
jgi:hypothetical protein